MHIFSKFQIDCFKKVGFDHTNFLGAMDVQTDGQTDGQKKTIMPPDGRQRCPKCNKLLKEIK